MTIQKIILTLTAALLFAANYAHGSPIKTLYSSGLSADGSLLPAGADDPHYFVLENSNTPAQVLFNVSPYIGNDGASQWIWQDSSGLPTYVTRTFRTTFDLAGYDPATATINGLWGVDNVGADVILNGISLGITLPGVVAANYQSLYPFTISPGAFVAGVNTLDFIISDYGSISGFRTKLEGTANLVSLPLPGTALSIFFGFLGLTISSLRDKKSRQ